MSVVLIPLFGPLLSCGKSPEGPAPPQTPTLTLVAGSNVSDTISAMRTQGLVAEVHGTDGKPEAGVVVDFQSVAQSCTTYSCAGVLMASPTDATGYFRTSASTTTDAKGRAVVRIQLGMIAGAAGVAVTVPVYGLADTARFTVQPGAPTRVTVAPRDTALETGGSFQLRASAADRAGNAVSLPSVTYATSGSIVTVSAGGRVTAVGEGRGLIRVLGVVAGKSVADSAHVSVVPKARIAASDNSGPIRLTNLTGSPEKTVVPGHVDAQDWSPTGDRLVHTYELGSGTNTYGLAISDTLGNSTPLPVPVNSSWPQYSADGKWVYFMLLDGYQIDRIRPDGTGLEAIMSGSRVSPAPDGRIAVSTISGIWVGDPVTKVGATVPNTSSAESLDWSPNGQWIAYRSGSAIVMIHPDGTGKRSWAADFAGGITWSPDSRWILGGGYDSMLLINTASGATLTPSIARGLYPAWKP